MMIRYKDGYRLKLKHKRLISTSQGSTQIIFIRQFRHIGVDHLVDFLKSFAIELRLV